MFRTRPRLAVPDDRSAAPGPIGKLHLPYLSTECVKELSFISGLFLASILNRYPKFIQMNGLVAEKVISLA